MEREQLVSLVTRAQNGDGNALNELFNAFYDNVYYFALKTVKDSDLAADITQESFVEILSTINNLKEPAAFVTWMKQITYHQCTRYFKKKKDVLVDETEDGDTIFDTVKEENSDFIPDEALDKDDFKKTILAILDELSEEQRSATVMYYFDELSVKQIAEIQGVSEGTIKSRLNYARKAIKASVEEYEKKNGIKLHAIPFFPLIHWVFKGAVETMPLATAETVAGGVSAATGIAVSASASGTVVGGASVAATAAVTTTATATTATATTAAVATTTVGIGAKIAALPLVTKVVALVTAAVITIGGGTAAVIMADNNDKDGRPTQGEKPKKPVTSQMTSSNNNSQDDDLIEMPNADDHYKKVNFGVYEQDGNFENGAEPIEWYIVTEQGDKTLLLSKYCIEYLPFDTSKNADWESSSIRRMLRKIANTTMFTREERKNIIDNQSQYVIQNPEGNPMGGFDQITKTVSDIIFLPSSYNELLSLFDETGLAIGKITEYAKSKIGNDEDFGNGYVRWFERNVDTMVRGDNPNEYVLTVVETGSTHVHGIRADQPAGIRPAIWVNSDYLFGNVEVIEPDKTPDETPDETPDDYPEYNDGSKEINYTVPAGYTYTSADGTVYNAGQTVKYLNAGDELKGFDYTYKYARMPFRLDEVTLTWDEQGWYRNWAVAVNDVSKTSYPDMLSEIGGIPVDTLINTFAYCRKMTVAPKLSVNAVELTTTFYQCTSLKTSPVIPSKVTAMIGTFIGCTSLVNAPELPSGLDVMSQTFTDCTALKVAPKIPNTVTSMDQTFYNCTSLTTVQNLPTSLQSLNNCFSMCNSLKTVPALPNGVKTIYNAFSFSGLVTAPTIPSSVTNMSVAFYHCTRLTGEIVINAKLNENFQCGGKCDICEANPQETCLDCGMCTFDMWTFKDTQLPITITGTSDRLNALAATATNGNVTVK